MNVYQEVWIKLDTTQVIFLRAFLKQFLRKLPDGEFHDVMQNFYEYFVRVVDSSPDEPSKVF